MHELAVTRSIHAIVVRHARQARAERVRVVHLEIGALSDLEAVWLQRYFDRLGRGTVTEGATLAIHHVPAVFRCDRCGGRFEVDSLPGADLTCRDCLNGAVTLMSGRTYLVRSMEVL